MPGDAPDADEPEAGKPEAVATRLIHTRGRRLDPPTVNPPLERGSTLLFPDRERLYGAKPTYGRMGHAVHEELRAALCDLEGASQAALTPNGVSACALAIAALVQAGDHTLISDGLYGPTRRFCERRLARMGVTTERVPAGIGAAIADRVTDKTTLIVFETPSSLTFEIPDLPALAEFARTRSIRLVVDNTWSAGVFLKPLAHGADVSVQALTKYAIGHADAFGGAVMTADPDIAKQIAACAEDWGIALGPEEAYTALRGLRTLPTRIAAHEAHARTLADWLALRPEVHRVLHPARPDHPDHALWQRDFTGSSGLFSVVLNATDPARLDAFLEAMTRFGMGFSWGGFESLLIPCDAQLKRLPGHWSADRPGPLLRIHAGLEDPADLIADLTRAFDAMHAG